MSKSFRVIILSLTILFLAGSIAPLAMASKNGAKVAQAQEILKQKGLFAGAITGELDAPTRSALREFQSQNGLNPTGSLNKKTLDLLGIESRKEHKEHKERKHHSRRSSYRQPKAPKIRVETHKVGSLGK